ncbi:unnamed protein product [Brassica oleracea var. botrytis]
MFSVVEEGLLVQKDNFSLCKQHLRLFFSNIQFNKFVILFFWTNV